MPLDLPARSYRVRFSAKRMDLANSVDSLPNDAPPIDSYLLTFWPAPPAPDRIVKVTSRTAAQWHERSDKTHSSGTARTALSENARSGPRFDLPRIPLATGHDRPRHASTPLGPAAGWGVPYVPVGGGQLS